MKNHHQPIVDMTLAGLGASIGMLLCALFAACSSSSNAGNDAPANCGPAADVYAAVGGTRVVGSYDGTELYTAWRDDTGLITLVRATKNGACIVHVGREIGPYIPL